MAKPSSPKKNWFTDQDQVNQIYQIEQAGGFNRGDLLSLAQAESPSGDVNKQSKTKAIGPFQFTTIARQQVEHLTGKPFSAFDATDPVKSAKAAGVFLNWIKQHYVPDGDWNKMMLVWNAGQNSLVKAGGDYQTAFKSLPLSKQQEVTGLIARSSALKQSWSKPDPNNLGPSVPRAPVQPTPTDESFLAQGENRPLAQRILEQPFAGFSSGHKAIMNALGVHQEPVPQGGPFDAPSDIHKSLMEKAIAATGEQPPAQGGPFTGINAGYKSLMEKAIAGTGEQPGKSLFESWMAPTPTEPHGATGTWEPQRAQSPERETAGPHGASGTWEPPISDLLARADAQLARNKQLLAKEKTKKPVAPSPQYQAVLNALGISGNVGSLAAGQKRAAVEPHDIRSGGETAQPIDEPEESEPQVAEPFPEEPDVAEPKNYDLTEQEFNPNQTQAGGRLPPPIELPGTPPRGTYSDGETVQPIKYQGKDIIDDPDLINALEQAYQGLNK